MTVVTKESKHEFQVIEVFEFTSLRKRYSTKYLDSYRQSILLKSVTNDEVWLYSKGADSILLSSERLSKKEINEKEKLDNLVS